MLRPLKTNLPCMKTQSSPTSFVLPLCHSFSEYQLPFPLVVLSKLQKVATLYLCRGTSLAFFSPFLLIVTAVIMSSLLFRVAVVFLFCFFSPFFVDAWTTLVSFFFSFTFSLVA